MKALTNWRIWMLAVLALTATFCLFGEPTATDGAEWEATFLISKTVGFTAAYAAYRLARRWAKAGLLVDADDFKEAEDGKA